MPRTLAWRLTARYLLVLAALLLASAGFQYVALRQFLLRAAAARLASEARTPLQAYREAVAAGTPPASAGAALLQALRTPRTEAQLAGPGALPPPAAAAGLRLPRLPLPPAAPPRVRVAGGFVYALLPLGPPGPPLLLLATPVPDVLGVLGSELRLLLAGGLGALLLGGASAAWAVRRALRPLREITAVAGRIAAGDLGARAGQAGAPSEVAQLAGAFDAMVDRLAAAIAEERETHLQMRRFLDDASHEMRTPLTALTGTLEVLQGAAGGDPLALHEGLRSAHRQSRRLGALVRGMLALARAERPDGLPLAPVDLRGVLAGVRGAAERLAADHELHWEEGAEPLPVLANAELLGGAFLNVLDNAVRYSPLGGRIRVTAAREGATAVIAVADAGPGIAATDLPHVFERFYRGGAGAAAPAGTGLGLAIVRSVLQRHGGQAEIASAPGRGTTVRLRLPLRPAPAG